MERLAKLITAIGTLLWPLIFFFLLFRFSDPLAKVIESWQDRKISLKVAGNELTVEEASQQQVRLLSDLQSTVAQLEAAITPHPASPQSVAATPVAGEATAPASTTRIARVLWVDDSPKNNSYVVALLNERGVRVDPARSTDAALRSFQSQHYDAVVTDMARPEGDRAGLDLTRRLREIDRDVPIYFYASHWAAQNLRDAVQQAGGNGITSSTSTLISSLLGGRRDGG